MPKKIPRVQTAAFAIVLALGIPDTAGALPPFALRSITPVDGSLYRETMLPADIDKDGDMDFYSGQGRGGKTWWFEHEGRTWTRRLVSDSNETDVGAALLDVDGDGWMDKVAGTWWYRNPGFPDRGPAGKAKAFGTCRYTEGSFYVHDLYPADMDGDGHDDILTIDYSGVRWFKVERDSACRPWAEHMINGYTDTAQHGGIAAGDLDGDGDMDVSRVDRWFENLDGKGLQWKEHANIDFGTYWPSGWGISGRALIFDLDGDGAKDLVQTECDVPNGRVAWFSNQGGKGLAWKRHIIKDSTDGQDFHSLAPADFDGDGDLDLFSAGAGVSEGPNTSYIWENLDGKGGSWREHIVNTGKKEHEGAAADMDGDGDVDILIKTWAAGDQYYLENQLIPNPGWTALKRVSIGTPPAKAYRSRSGRSGNPEFIGRGRAHDARGRSEASTAPPGRNPGSRTAP
jgi:hypothetical protein